MQPIEKCWKNKRHLFHKKKSPDVYIGALLFKDSLFKQILVNSVWLCVMIKDKVIGLLMLAFFLVFLLVFILLGNIMFAKQDVQNQDTENFYLEK